MSGTLERRERFRPAAVIAGDLPPERALSPPDDATRLRIAMSLQTSLAIGDVIAGYFDLTQPALGLDGLRFQHADGGDTRSGRLLRHRASYRLTDERGALGTLTLHRTRRFAEADLAWFESTLELLARPLRNALMHEEALTRALTDGLTGAGNRTALDAVVPRQIEIARRHGHDLAVLMVDIDHFKAINDRRGHAFGDEVLRAMVQLMQQAVRRSDAIYRYGGEEFVVLLSSTTGGGAGAMAERIRGRVEQMRLVHRGRAVPVTVSIGATALQPEDTVHTLFERADQALYQAKAEGRNRCVLARDLRNVRRIDAGERPPAATVIAPAVPDMQSAGR